MHIYKSFDDEILTYTPCHNNIMDLLFHPKESIRRTKQIKTTYPVMQAYSFQLNMQK